MPDVLYFLEDLERKDRRKDNQIEGTQRNIRMSHAMKTMLSQHPPTTWTATKDGEKKIRVSWEVKRSGQDFEVTSKHEEEKDGEIKTITKTHTLSPNRLGPCVGER